MNPDFTELVQARQRLFTPWDGIRAVLVLLGHVKIGASRRWLNDDEISGGVIRILDDAESALPRISIVGEIDEMIP
jgi:hypothetical protein